MKLTDYLQVHFLEEGGMACLQGGIWKEHPVCRDSQTGGKLRGRTRDQASLLGVMVEYTSKRPEGTY